MDWDLKTNKVEWNIRLLEMLGFTDQHDLDAYRHMSFFERIHPEDISSRKSSGVENTWTTENHSRPVFDLKQRITITSGLMPVVKRFEIDSDTLCTS